MFVVSKNRRSQLLARPTSGNPITVEELVLELDEEGLILELSSQDLLLSLEDCD